VNQKREINCMCSPRDIESHAPARPDSSRPCHFTVFVLVNFGVSRGF
jgi:hypothetical protein